MSTSPLMENFTAAAEAEQLHKAGTDVCLIVFQDTVMEHAAITAVLIFADTTHLARSNV